MLHVELTSSCDEIVQKSWVTRSRSLPCQKHVLVKQLKKVLETEWYHNQMLPSEYIASKMTMGLT